ncbi:MAG: hypothetical protein JNL17_14150 [Cyclobacteriaceae bacterium]|nr:hypothetical protein [Cyclobacteriaceae bacterium]
MKGWVYFDDFKITHTGSPVLSGADYYPFGLTMTEREILDEAYRYGYQGQYSEEDKTTGWNEFELRMYDARFGRWTSIDPYRQFASPYVGMGNSPVDGVDPDGGFKNRFGALLYKTFNGGGEVYHDGSEWVVRKSDKITFDGQGTMHHVVSIGGWGDGTETLGRHLGNKILYSDIWNSNLARAVVPDVVTVDLTGSASFFVIGSGATHTYNLVLRGKDFGIHETNTVTSPNRFGLEVDGGLNFGFVYTTGDPREFVVDRMLGRTHNISGGFVAGGTLTWGTDGQGNVLTWGLTTGFGATGGASYGRGMTVRSMSDYGSERHLFLKESYD